MKSLGKVFFLLIIVGLIVFAAWKVIDSTLFADENTTLPPATQIVQTPPPVQEPETLTQDQAFESTSDDTSAATAEIKLTCQVADTIITKLYDMRASHADYDQAVDFIHNNEDIPSSQVDAFVDFAHTLWNLPIGKLGSKETVLTSFNARCQQLEN